MMIRRLSLSLSMVFIVMLSVNNRANAQPVYPPYGPPSYEPAPPGAVPPVPRQEEPMGMERRERFVGHPYVILEWLPLNDWRFDLGFGPEADLGMGGTLTAGYMSYFGLGIELRAGGRHHASNGYDLDNNFIDYAETEIPLLAGLRFDMASIWGGGFVGPFIASHVGTGGYFYSDSDDNSYSEWDFMLDVGVGIDFYVADWIGLGLGYWFEYYAISEDITMHSLAVQLTL